MLVCQYGRDGNASDALARIQWLIESRLNNTLPAGSGYASKKRTNQTMRQCDTNFTNQREFLRGFLLTT